MSFAGRLETLDLSALLQTLAASGATGRLTLTRVDRHAILLLRGGRLVYGAFGPGGLTLAGLLLHEGIVSEADLTEALERQHEVAEPRRLGELLLESGALSAVGLRQAVVRYLQRLLTELIAWKTGFFRFEPLPEDTTAVEAEIGDLALPDGVAPQELLMRVLTALEHPETAEGLGSPAPSARPAPRSGPEFPLPLGEGELQDVPETFTGEVALRLLRFASQILSRAVLFYVHGDTAFVLGEFGLRLPGRSAAEAMRQTYLPLREPSLLRFAVTRRRTYVGPLEPTPSNLQLATWLGGARPAEAVAVPLVVHGEVRLVLYGDNLPEGRPIGPVDALESAAGEAARAMERTLPAPSPPAPRGAS